MKRITCIILVVLLAALLCLPAAAAQYQTLYDLFNDWETNGYPNDVGGVFSTDGSMDHLTILLVDNSEARQQEIRAMLADDSGLSFGEAAYSRNKLAEVHQEIVETYMGSGGAVVGCGIGWATIDGEVTGFGPSGRESRVVVTVEEAHLDEYVKLFHDLYGDLVYVEGGSMATTAEEVVAEIGAVDTSTDEPAGIAVYVIIVLMLALICGAMVFSRRHSPAAQTTAGGQMEFVPAPYTRKRTREAVRDSTPTPSPSVRDAIRAELDK